MDATTVYLWFVAFLLLPVMNSSAVEASNPGLQLRLSQGGLNYAANVAIDIALSRRIDLIRIPDQKGTARAPIGNVDYELTNIRVTKFVKPLTSVAINPGRGLTWSLNNIGLSLTGNWRYNFKRGFVRIQDHGSFDGTLSDTSASVSIEVAMDTASGSPTIGQVSCDIDIRGLSITIHGGASWFYSLFMRYLENPLKENLRELICKEVRETVEGDARAELATLQLQVPLDDSSILDYRLLSPPVFNQAGFVDFFHKGEVFLNGDATEAPFQPEPFPASETQQMVTIWISDYLFNTFAHTLYRRYGSSSYYVTQSDLSDSPDSGFLSTSCSRTSCFGAMISQVGQAYPNASVEIEMIASRTPQIGINSSEIQIRAFSLITFTARLSNGSSADLFKTNVSISTKLKAELDGSVLKGTLLQFLPRISVVDSSIGEVSQKVLRTVVMLACNVLVVPKLKQVLEKGVPLPPIKNVALVNPNLEMQTRCLRIASDIRYSATP